MRSSQAARPHEILVFLFAPPLALVFSILGPMISDLKGPVTSDLRAAGSWTVETDLRPELLAL